MAPKILLIQLRQLGDILLTTPCLREIRRAWPEAHISFMTHPMGRLILKDNPYLDQHIVYDPKASWRQEWQLLRQLRAGAFDMVLDFMYNPRSALYARITGAPRRLAFPSRRSLFFTETVPQGGKVEYIVSEKFRYLTHLGLKPESPALDLPWFPADAHRTDLWSTEEPRFAEAPLRIVLSPTHRRAERQWPLDRFARLADRLSLEWGATVIWIWGPGEKEFVEGIQARCLQPSLLAPATSFRELAALIARSDLFIGNSNGPSHVAVAVDTPSMQIHGPTYAATWCPLSTRHHAVQACAQSDTLASLGRGPIDLISEEELWQALSSLRKPVEVGAAARRRLGERRAWQGPFTSEQGDRS